MLFPGFWYPNWDDKYTYMLGVVSNAVEELEEAQFWAEEAKNVLSSGFSI